jgi:modulator of FtsH protease HflC
MSIKATLFTFIGLVVALILYASAYTVSMTEQVIITQFGKPVGAPITEAGLNFKVPFIQTVNRLEKRVLEWDGDVTEMPTKDKLYISVDTFARWQIKDPQEFFIRMKDERSALSRLSDVLGSETRNSVAAHNLVELVRTNKDRKPVTDTDLGEAALSTGLPAITVGRQRLEEEIFAASKPKLVEYGIELLDLRIKRVTYNPAVANKIFQRMVSERQQIAARYRAEGEGEAAKILGQRERDLKQIESEAYRKVQAIEGKADADASAIYAQAYNQSPQAREFYTFIRTLETYRTSFAKGTTVVLTTDDGFLHFLKGEKVEGRVQEKGAAPVPAPPPPVER